MKAHDRGAAVRVGVIGCSRFARRTMIPALLECADVAELAAVASRDPAKAASFATTFGVEGLTGYAALLERADIEAVYLPLPVALHEEWIGAALARGKHVLVEKSFTTDYASAERIVRRARAANRLVVENFAFLHHDQIGWIQHQVESGVVGRVHLVRSAFGFPSLPKEDIRYKVELGGGALLDIGCYTLRVAQLVLGQTLRIVGAAGSWDSETGVDTRGAILCANAHGQVAQLSYGFGYHYHCRLELMGSVGTLTADRVFTAPPDLKPPVRVQTNSGVEEATVPAHNQYARLWRRFAARLRASKAFDDAYEELLRQARLVDDAAQAMCRKES